MSCSVNLHRPDKVSARHFGDFSSLTVVSPDGDDVSIFFGGDKFPNHREIADAMAEAFNSRAQPAGTRVAPAVVEMLDDDL